MIYKDVKVSIIKVGKIRRIPESLNAATFHKINKILEVEDGESYTDEEAKEIAVMALQDCEPQQAVEVVLACIAEGDFTKGQAQNLTEELKEDEPWDEYADMEDHYTIYRAVDLLYEAFPDTYSEPSMSHVVLSLTHEKFKEKEFRKGDLTKLSILKIISELEDSSSILNRLFADQLQSGIFPEAEYIIWRYETSKNEPEENMVEIFGSHYWFKGLDEGLSCTLGLSVSDEDRSILK